MVNDLNKGFKGAFEQISLDFQDSLDAFKQSFREEFYANEKQKKDALKKATEQTADNQFSPKQSTRIPPPKVPEPTTSKSKPKSEFLSKPRILYIGDSVAQNIDAKIVEKSNNIRIRTVKAYSSVADKKAK